MDDMGLNRWLQETYGQTIDSKPLFRLVWSDEQYEHRKSVFRDFHDDLFIREVEEVRYVPKYPFITIPTWVLEKIYDVTPEVGQHIVGVKYSYEMIYAFMDKNGNPLPLTKDKLEEAMYLFFNFYIMMTPKERLDFRFARLAEKHKEERERAKQLIGETLRSPLFIVKE